MNSVICPVCNITLEFDCEIDGMNFTTDCQCGTLLLVNNGIAQDFHESLHNSDSRWPKDGKNTGFVEVEV